MRQIVFVLPVTGESLHAAQVLDRIRVQAIGRDWRSQLVVVDDVGDETTRAALAAASIQMPLHIITHRFPRGWGESLRDGLEWVAEHCDPSDVAVVLAADDSHDPDVVPAMLAALDAGADVAIASRFRRGSFVVGHSLPQRLLSWAAALALRPFLGIPGVRDYTGGFYAVRVQSLRVAMEAYRGRFIELTVWERAASGEVLCKLAQRGARCVEVAFAQRADRQAAPRRRQLAREVSGYARLAARAWLDVTPAPQSEPESAPIPRWEWGTLAVIMVAALALRLYAIGRIPAVVFHDECDNLVNVYQILNGRGPGFFGLDWKPQPAASVYLLSVFMRASMSLVALRLPAALFSVAALVPFFILVRGTLAAPVALLATALLASDTWYLHFSRTGWENIDACLFFLAAAVCMRSALQTGALRSFAFAGVWSALGLYGPFSGRSTLPAILLIGAASLRRPRIGRRRLLFGLFTTTIVALVLFGPQLRTVVSDWNVFQKRTRAVFILGGDNVDKPALAKVGIVFEAFARKGSEIFAPSFAIGRERADRYLRTETGALARPTAFLLGVGMLASLFWLGETWQWWVLLLVPFVITEAITIGSLNGARGIVFVPILYWFIGLAVHVVWTLCRRLYRPLVALVVAGTLALAADTTRQYFDWAQSPLLLNALEPAIPVTDFPEWQSFLLNWTATRSEFYNLDMWKARQAELHAPHADAAGGP